MASALHAVWSQGKDSHPGDSDVKIKLGKWASKMEYLITLFGYAIGMGTVWRFPYMTYKHGGGAFLIPYTMMLVLAGMPLFFLECALGQFSNLGPILVWRCAPILQGLGYCMIQMSLLLSIYYNVMVAYSIYYIFASFKHVLPWTDCFHWADEKCNTQSRDLCNVTLGGTITVMNLTWVDKKNLTCDPGSIIYQKVESPTMQYWDKVVLRRSTGIDDNGEIVWHLAFCLLLAWILITASLIKGLKTSGKVKTFFSYVMLTILLVRGLTLDGAWDGINFYTGVESVISKLQNAEIWKDAASQIFFSLSTSFGGLIVLSSYNKFNNNCYLDAILVPVANCFTSLYAGLVIFSIMGHMAHEVGKNVSEVSDSGFGLAFIVYPESLIHLPVSPFWSFLFFCMLVSMGVDAQFTLVESALTAFEDSFPKVMEQNRAQIIVGCCVILFLLGLPCVTQAGIYWVLLIDSFSVGWTFSLVAVIELMGVCWIYGGNRLIQNLEMMIGAKNRSFWLWWRICWLFVSPAILLVIILWSLATFSAPTYGTFQYPTWSIILGWLMTISCLIWLPVIAIVNIYKAEGTLWQRFSKICKPAANWGPELRKIKEKDTDIWL